jgi:hypothetical protein
VDGLTRDPTGMYELAIRRATANGFANETAPGQGRRRETAATLTEAFRLVSETGRNAEDT